MDNQQENSNLHDKEQANKEATGRMAENHDEQYAKFQESQNDKTTGEKIDNEHMLENKGNIPDDALPLKEQNRNRFKDEQNDDFGVEQL